MKPSPWMLDGYKFFDEDTEKYIYSNTRIKDYLSIGNHESRFFLIGAKGLGKTLLLRYKSYLYHTELGNTYKFNASIHELTDNLDINHDTFSKDDLLKFQSIELWEKIWSLALWILIFKTYGLEIPKEIERTINGATKISPIFSYLLAERNKINRFTDFRNQLLANNHKIQSGVALFIDDVDQSFEKILRDEHYSDDSPDYDTNPTTRIWINAQMGLVAAIYSIYRQNSHIKIYAAIRREPWEAAKGALIANYRNHATFLQYNKDEIKQIFEGNIMMMNNADYVNPRGKNFIEKFIGFDLMPHRFAKTSDGRLRNEDVFEFIYRHTFGRPREIVLLGLEISHLCRSELYKQKTLNDQIVELRSIVNKQSGDLFNNYRQEIIPRFSELELDDFIKNMKTNVIEEKDLKRFSPETLNKYYNFGLLGYSIHYQFDVEGKEVFKQNFLPPATYNYTKTKKLPKADYYFTHPSMDSRLIEHLTYLKSYNPTNIIGVDYLFYPFPNEEPIPLEQATYYLPEEVSGARWDQGSASYRHELPLKEYYQAFFEDLEHKSWCAKFDADVKAALEAFTLVSRICYCSRLKSTFGSFYEEKINKFTKDLERINLVRRYGTRLKSKSEKNMIVFCDRIFGRLLVLGCYLFNDLTVESIHHLLRNSIVDFKVSPEGNSSDKYLNRCFFISNLHHTDHSPAGNSHRNEQKNLVFAHISAFEKQILIEGIKSIYEEIKNAKWFEKEEHRSWLEQEVVSKVWIPSGFTS